MVTPSIEITREDEVEISSRYGPLVPARGKMNICRVLALGEVHFAFGNKHYVRICCLPSGNTVK
jgi:hypothetical protein